MPSWVARNGMLVNSMRLGMEFIHLERDMGFFDKKKEKKEIWALICELYMGFNLVVYGL